MNDRGPLHEVAPGDRWLVVVAHPDDETFGCGSLIAYAARAGAHVTVVCATRGEAGERTDAVPADADLGAVRVAELHDAAAILGAHQVEVLDYADSGFDGPMPAGALAGAPVDRLATRFGDLVAEHRPTVVVVLDGSDGHRDHVHVRDAMRAALPGVAASPLLVEIGLPNRLMRLWAEEMRTAHPDVPYLEIDLERFGTPDDRITDVVELADLVELRERAMAAHRSQRPPTDGLSRAVTLAFIERAYLVRR